MDLDYSFLSVPVEKVDDTSLINEVIKRKLEHRDSQEVDDPFYIVDLNAVVRKHHEWRRLLPRVTPFYAMKALPEPAILELIASLGLGFDCASKNEIDAALKAGATPERIIYAHTCKPPDMLRFAAANGVSLMTFDNEEELYKIRNVFPDASLVIRILPPKAKKVYTELGEKFGCPPDQVRRLLQIAKSLKLNVVGVSFHVGFGCQDAWAYVTAIVASANVFEVAASEGFSFNLLDIGGGFPGHPDSGITMEEIVQVLSPALDKHFPEESGVRLIAEPGTFFCASAMHLVAKVIGRRVTTVPRNEQDCGDCNSGNDSTVSNERVYEYYLNEGLYGSFCRGVEGARRPMPVCARGGDAGEERDGHVPMHYTIIYGPTRDHGDILFRGVAMQERKIGDWVLFPYTGHYSISTLTAFESMPRPPTYYMQLASIETSLIL